MIRGLRASARHCNSMTFNCGVFPFCGLGKASLAPPREIGDQNVRAGAEVKLRLVDDDPAAGAIAALEPRPQKHTHAGAGARVTGGGPRLEV